MTPVALILLTTSILLSTGRNLLSKRLSGLSFGSRRFFLCQGALFFSGGVAVLLFGRVTWQLPSGLTCLLALLYGALLIAAQWFYTAALSSGNVALCSTVYSMGFILPTLSGALLWNESFSPLDLCGVLCSVAAILCSGLVGRRRDTEKGYRYFLPLTVAMLASGGLGIVQKTQQRSDVAGERGAFLLIAFLIAAGASVLVALLLGRRQGASRDASSAALMRSMLGTAALVGAFFGCCNLLNTLLAGMLDSAIFFPTLNIGVILISTVTAIPIYRERLKKKDLCVLLLGIGAILLLNFG